MDPTTTPVVDCSECGAREAADYMPSTAKAMVERRLCFSCLFWTRWVEEADDNVMRADGKHYVIGAEDATGPFRGHGGAQFIFITRAGKIIVSTNVWSQGTIPEHFRSRLPDNAILIPDKLEISVTSEDIAEGTVSSFSCPIARATNRVLFGNPWLNDKAYAHHGAIGYDDDEVRLYWNTPSEASYFMSDFDGNIPVNPITVTLTKPHIRKFGREY